MDAGKSKSRFGHQLCKNHCLQFMIMLIWIFYSLFLVLLGRSFDLVTENLTGLAFLHRKWLPLFIFCLLTCLIFFTFSATEEKIRQNWTLFWLLGFSCLCMGLFPLVPYLPDHPILNDLHVWGTIAGFALYQAVWICAFLPSFSDLYLLSVLSSDDRTVLMVQVLILAGGWLIICFTGHISGLSELIYGFLEVTFLCWRRIYSVRRQRK